MIASTNCYLSGECESGEAVGYRCAAIDKVVWAKFVYPVDFFGFHERWDNIIAKLDGVVCD